MNTSIKQRVGCALLSFLLVAVFIGSLLCALILPFLSSNGVASADSTNGVVENNIILNSSFSDFSNWSVAGASVLSNNPLLFSATGAWGSVYQILPYQELFDKTVTLTVRFRKVSGDSSAVCNLRYRLEGQSSTTGLQSISTASTDFVLRSQTYNLSELINLSYLQVSIYGQTSGTQVEVDFVKLEIGSTFTGYVPKDYENYGYNQGYEQGLNDEFDLRAYRYLDNFSYTSSSGFVNLDFDSDKFSTSFNFDGKKFLIDRYYVSPSASSAYYHNIGSFYSLYDSSSVHYYGLKYTNNLLSGDILITFPFVFCDDDFDIMFCFEDTVTGSLNYVTSSDSLHWFWGNIIGQYNDGFSLDEYPVYSCQLHYFSSNPCNLYVFNRGMRPAYNSSSVQVLSVRGLKLPLDTSWSNIYATSVRSALNSFDDGYAKGVEAGIESAQQSNAQAVVNARAQGYEQGRRDALSDDNDYTFFGLLGAVIDAPIKSFNGLLDFNILGTNLRSFVLAMLSLSVIIIVIKIALGGK